MAEVRWYGAEVLKEVGKQAMELVEKKAEQVEEEAKELAPVRTGALRDSIKRERDKRGILSRVGSNLPYALERELGSVGRPAHPYLRPALEKVKD